MGKTSGDQPATSKAANSNGEGPDRVKKAAFALSQEPVLGEAQRVQEPAKPVESRVSPEPAVGASVDGAWTGGNGGSGVPAYEDLGSLPETYNVDTLFLTARDPRWVFSYWDIDFSRYPGAVHRFKSPQFFLRLTTGSGLLESTLEIKPEARNWYVPVQHPDTEYFAEMGYYDLEGRWIGIVKSGGAWTPSDTIAGDTEAQFATVPARLSFERLRELVAAQMEQGESLLQAVSRIAGLGTGAAPGWTEEQRALLAALLGESLVDRMGLGSAEIDQLLRKQLLEKLQSESASELAARLMETLRPESALSSGAFASWTAAEFSRETLSSGITSWGGGLGASWSAQPFSVKRERKFFMHVNAEIIFYGGTDPDATVWIDGKEIQLQPDGTFRYHFLLPDGDHAVPIVARSPDGVEERSATLSFVRGTQRRGDVGATAQPAELEPLIGRKS
ncbi:MAG: hypothetical protein RLZZ253_2244 [Verrucomicrobiota bacterium]